MVYGHCPASERHLNHPQPKPSSVQNAAGSTHQESDSTATNEQARTDHQPSLKSSSARNHLSSSSRDFASIIDEIFQWLTPMHIFMQNRLVVTTVWRHAQPSSSPSPGITVHASSSPEMTRTIAGLNNSSKPLSYRQGLVGRQTSSGDYVEEIW